MVKSNVFQELNDLTTEARLSASQDIDLADSLTICRIINNEDKQCAIAVEAVLDRIAQAIDMIAEAFKQGGRLIYIGAGTSGRLGVLDASECPPTFGSDPNRVIGLIAGGDIALRQAQEGSEDQRDQAVIDLKHLNINDKDVLCGIMASGRTPYVIAGIEFARLQGLKTIAISCNHEKFLKVKADISICMNAGPEVISGSTRMKAGTMQKMVLNMLSTGSMIRIGKVYKNIMVDLQMNSQKLVERSKKIIMELCHVSYQEAEKLLFESKNDVKVAIVMGITNLTALEAKKILMSKEGVIRRAIC